MKEARCGMPRRKLCSAREGQLGRRRQSARVVDERIAEAKP
jgi:hypothetical protein